MFITALSYANAVISFFSSFWKDTKYLIVGSLGSLPTDYYLLRDGRVLSDTIELPDYERAHAYVYQHTTNTICKATDMFPQGRFRALPYLSITFQNTYIHRVDISDWIGEIRANPVPQDISVKQLLRLWSCVNHRYVPEGEGTIIHVTDSDANETVIT